MTLDTGFPPTTPDAPIAVTVLATLPGKTHPHHVSATFTVNPLFLRHHTLEQWLDVKLRDARETLLDKYREAQAAE